MTGFLQDLRYSLKALAKNRAFTVVAVLSLTLGIGLNTAVFSIVEAFFLRAQPGRDPNRLVTLECKTPQMETSCSYPDYQDIREQSKTLSGILAHSGHVGFLKVGSDTEMITVDVVSPNFFSVLGLTLAAGHTFADQNQQGNEPVLVLSYARWQRDFAGDRSLVGKSVWLNRKPYTVIGIAPRDFPGLERLMATDAWVPLNGEYGGASANRDYSDLGLIGRLQSNVSAEQARVELDTIGRRLAAAYPASEAKLSLILESEQDRLRKAMKPALFIMSVVWLVLLIACANVAGLMLARSEARRSEFAVRTALGAGRGRLLRQVLTESVLLASVSAVFGLTLTRLLIQFQGVFNPMPAFPLRLDMRVGGPTLIFTVVSALLTTMLFGLAPALGITKPDLVSSLKGTSRTVGQSKRRFPLRNVLVVGQIALSVVLLATTGLLLRSLLFSMRIPLGFDDQKQLVFVEVASYEGRSSAALFSELAERLSTLPGVKQTSFARRGPLTKVGDGAVRKVSIPGVEVARGQQAIPVKFNSVGLGYFRMMGTRILKGRDFSSADGPSGPKVALINQIMAQRYWPNEDPVGKHLQVDGKDCEIIGITERTTMGDIHEDPEPYMYFPFSQAAGGDGVLIIETITPPSAMIPAIRKTIHAVDSNVPIIEMLTVSQLMNFALSDDRISAGLVGVLGIVGMFLAAVGLYGVVAYLAYRRSHEMGVRMALGAQKRHIMMLVVGHGFRLAMVGILIGMVGAFAVTRLMSSMLYGVKPNDPVTFGATAVCVIAIALLASYVPAARAARVDPVVALRYE
jgi:predicted permease